MCVSGACASGRGVARCCRSALRVRPLGSWLRLWFAVSVRVWCVGSTVVSSLPLHRPSLLGLVCLDLPVAMLVSRRLVVALRAPRPSSGRQAFAGPRPLSYGLGGSPAPPSAPPLPLVAPPHGGGGFGRVVGGLAPALFSSAGARRPNFGSCRLRVVLGSFAGAKFWGDGLARGSGAGA